MARLTDDEGEQLEAGIQRDVIAYLRLRGWFVIRLTGNAYQTGIPDIWAWHPKFDFRWIDLKRPDRYDFTAAQKAKWPQWHAAGVGVWIMTAASQEEYDKLFSPPNWRDYWKQRYGNLDDTIDALAAQRRGEV